MKYNKGGATYNAEDLKNLVLGVILANKIGYGFDEYRKEMFPSSGVSSSPGRSSLSVACEKLLVKMFGYDTCITFGLNCKRNKKNRYFPLYGRILKLRSLEDLREGVKGLPESSRYAQYAQKTWVMLTKHWFVIDGYEEQFEDKSVRYDAPTTYSVDFDFEIVEAVARAVATCRDIAFIVPSDKKAVFDCMLAEIQRTVGSRVV